MKGTSYPNILIFKVKGLNIPIIKVYTILAHKGVHLKILTGTSLSGPNTSKLKMECETRM